MSRLSISSDFPGPLMCQVLHKGLQVQRSQAGSSPRAARAVPVARLTDHLAGLPLSSDQAQGFCSAGRHL